jgi:hypothetical protein
MDLLRRKDTSPSKKKSFTNKNAYEASVDKKSAESQADHVNRQPVAAMAKKGSSVQYSHAGRHSLALYVTYPRRVHEEEEDGGSSTKGSVSRSISSGSIMSSYDGEEHTIQHEEEAGHEEEEEREREREGEGGRETLSICTAENARDACTEACAAAGTNILICTDQS